jgi:SSS family solute:Na+ symporter
VSTEIFYAFALYLSCLITIGLLSHRKNTTAADFMVGGRSLSYWVTAISAHASDMSSWLFMAFPMALYTTGLSASWIAIGLILGMWANWHFVAPKLRDETEKYNSYTLASYFESRFNDSSGIIRLVTATATIVFILHYLSAGLISMGLLFESIFGIDYTIGITLATFVVLTYTVFGGYVAVAYTDFFQGMFLMLMIILVPAVSWSHIDGWEGIMTAAMNKGISLSVLPKNGMDAVNSLFLAVAWGLGYFGLPHVLTKFMGISSSSEMHKAKYLGVTWQIISMTGAAMVGLIGIAFFSGGLLNPELVFVETVKTLFPPFFGGLILCGILAATISTMDSQVLVVSALVTEDFYKKIWNKNATSKELVMISRISVVFASLFALVIAFGKSDTIYRAVFYAWSGLGCSFGPLMLASLYSNKVTKEGAIAGILGGALVAGFWPQIQPMLPIAMEAMIPGFVVSFTAIYTVSALTRNGEAKVRTL